MIVCQNCQRTVPEQAEECPHCGATLVPDGILASNRKKADRVRKWIAKSGWTVSKIGFIKERDLGAFLSKQYGVPEIQLGSAEISEEIVALVPEAFARKHWVMPISKAAESLLVAFSDPSNIFAIDELKDLTKRNIEVCVASKAEIEEAIERHYHGSDS